MEMRDRAVRLVLEHQGEYPSQWAAIGSIATKCGMTPETLRKWVRRAEVDGGARPGLTTDERRRLAELERENRELKEKLAELYLENSQLKKLGDWLRRHKSVSTCVITAQSLAQLPKGSKS